MKRYIGNVTGLSRGQVTRLIEQYVKSGTLQARRGRGRGFKARYTPADIALLAEVDEAHETQSGPATQKILYRQYYEFADAGYERLASISVAHIYNLRKRRSYPERRLCFCQDPAHAGGDRRAPQARARPMARLPARGHGALGQSGRNQGCLSHQTGGRGDAVA
jgi:hypothetical protein